MKMKKVIASISLLLIVSLASMVSAGNGKQKIPLNERSGITDKPAETVKDIGNLDNSGSDTFKKNATRKRLELSYADSKVSSSASEKSGTNSRSGFFKPSEVKESSQKKADPIHQRNILDNDSYKKEQEIDRKIGLLDREWKINRIRIRTLSSLPVQIKWTYQPYKQQVEKAQQSPESLFRELTASSPATASPTISPASQPGNGESQNGIPQKKKKGASPVSIKYDIIHTIP